MEIAMRKLSFTHVIYVLMLAIFVAGCNPSKTTYTIVTPANNSVLTEVPDTFVVRYSAKPSTAELKLNGVAVQRYFTFGDTEATASGADLAGYVVQGRNTFSADAKNLGPTVTFTLDTAGPKVVVTSVSLTEPKTVGGFATDISGVTRLSLNGVTVTDIDPSTGEFSAVVSTSSVYTFEAEDTLGHVSTTRVAPEGTKFNPLITAALNQSTVQAVGPVITKAMSETDLGPLLAEVNPVLNVSSSGLFGEKYGMTVDVQKIVMGTVDLSKFEILPTNNGDLAFEVNIYDLSADLKVKVLNGLLPSYDIYGTFSATHAMFSATIRLNAQNGKVVVTLPELAFDLDGAAINIKGVPSFLTSWITPLLDSMVDIFKGPLADFAAAIVSDLLADQLNEMIVNTNIRIDPTAVAGDEIEMGLETKVETIKTVDTNLVIGLSGGMSAISGDEGVAPALGSDYDTGLVPDPALDQGNVTAVVSSNLLNQAMLVAYKVGLIHGWIFDKVHHFGTKTDDTVGKNNSTRIRFAPNTPPAFHIAGNDTVVATIELNEFDVFLDKKSATGWEQQFAARLDIGISVEMGVDEKNHMTIGMVGTPTFNIVDIQAPFAVDEAKLNEAINAVMPLLAPALAQSVAVIEFPTFMGLQLLPQKISAVGPTNEHFSFSAELGAVVTP